MKTFDEIRDIAISIVDDLVKQGIVKDCADTEDEQEFQIQDIIIHRLLKNQKKEILNLYAEDRFYIIDKDLIDNSIEYCVIETDEIIDDWRGWAKHKHHNYLTDEIYEYFMDFDEYYDNGKTHPENWERFKKFHLQQETETEEKTLNENAGLKTDKQFHIEQIDRICKEYGKFTVADVEADHSPCVQSKGKLTHLMEEFREGGGAVRVYASFSSDEIDEYDEFYEELDDNEIEYIYELALRWAETNEEF